MKACKCVTLIISTYNSFVETLLRRVQSVTHRKLIMLSPISCCCLHLLLNLINTIQILTCFELIIISFDHLTGILV